MAYELGLIGGGNMAEAIVRAALDHQVLEADRIIVSDPSNDRRELFEQMGVRAVSDNHQVVEHATQIMLAIKPQKLEALGDDLAGLDADKQIVLSIMAGVSTEKIERALGREARIVRIMPNTPLLAGVGMSAVCLGAHARKGDELLAMQIFRAAGEAVAVEETDMDAVTAVSGSGPAYVYYLAEAMSEAARSLGLSDEQASLLVQQTALGAATLMRQSEESPAELRKRVMSPGGTTEAAVKHLEQTEVRQHVADAVRAAAERSKELGG